MKPWSKLVFASVLSSAACFNPSDGGLDTEAGSTGPTTSGTSVSGATSESGSTTGTTTDPSTSAGTSEGSTGGGAPEWGEGEPPDFGDLGPDGEGSILVVHALDTTETVDVWLVGEASPRATELGRGEAIRLTGVPRDARRLVLATTGTTDAVGCSDWFPLRADEQWAVVSARQSHTCPSPVTDGASITFEQALPLSGSPLRFVHAGAPDELEVLRGTTPEAGTLPPLDTLAAQDLPDCSGSGCVIPYSLRNAGLGLERFFTFLAAQVADVPPAGEVMLVVLGDLREDWPNEPASMSLLRVDIDGAVRAVGRDPEVAVMAFGGTGAVSFSLESPPTLFEFANVLPCDAPCQAPVQRFAPGAHQLYANPATGTPRNQEFDLAAGRRYVLAYADAGGGQMAFFEDTFDRSDTAISVGRGFNVVPSGDTLTIGRVFANAVEVFPEFVNIQSLGTSNEQDLPTGNWQLVFATGGATPMDPLCFSGVSTAAGWRGLVGAEELIDLATWPPVSERLFLACA